MHTQIQVKGPRLRAAAARLLTSLLRCALFSIIPQIGIEEPCGFGELKIVCVSRILV